MKRGGGAAAYAAAASHRSLQHHPATVAVTATALTDKVHHGAVLSFASGELIVVSSASEQGSRDARKQAQTTKLQRPYKKMRTEVRL
jgi:hypothetical protein